MINQFYQLNWHHDFQDEPVMILYEMQSDNIVTRMVETFRDQKSIADSLEISAKREKYLVNNICLCQGSFEPETHILDSKSSTDFDFKPISKTIFEEQFRNAELKLSED